jgi:asparagine synthase (glutamine-hydrolysing)
MCGIAGVYNYTDGAFSESALEEGLSLMTNRGPDGSGMYRDKEILLGHRRLAIIDLKTGDQPISNEDKSLWVICNGEIFNYIELRKELVKKGHRFSTTCDIEVLVHLYEDHGADFLSYLNGQFAMALWDTKAHKLILARDRFGICPLFYTLRGKSLIFSSTVKAMLPLIGKPEIDLQGLYQVFTFWNTLAPKTVYKDIYQLRPGECIIHEPGKQKSFIYWDIAFPPSGSHDITSRNEAEQGIREILDDAVSIRLRADVPVGAYLSGGLDSSILTTLVKGHTPFMETFSVSFADAAYDESAFQLAMGESLGTRHHVTKVSPGDIAEIFPQVIWNTETPILRTAPAPMYMLSKLTRSHGIKVVLTGEGSDELFGGYDIFKEAKIRRFWSRNPSSKLRPLLLFRLYPYSPVQMKRSGGLLISFYRTDLGMTDHFGYSHLPTWRNTSSILDFIREDLRDSLKDYDPVDDLKMELSPDFPSWHPLNQAQYLEMKLLLAGYLLCSQGERMAMANSVEGRYPFLDHRLAEFAARIHPSLKINGLKEKYILKKAFMDKLPPEIFSRVKQPYSSPNKESFFMNGCLKESYAQYLQEEAVRDGGIFIPRNVGRLVEKCARSQRLGFRDNSALIGILSTQIVTRQFC